MSTNTNDGSNTYSSLLFEGQSIQMDNRSFQMHGGWLMAARLLWIVVALFALSYFLHYLVIAFPAYLVQASADLYAPTSVWNSLMNANFFIVFILSPIFWCLVGIFLFCMTWSRERKYFADLIVLVVSLILVTVGLVLLSETFNIVGRPLTHLELPIWFHFLVTIFLILLLYLHPDGRFLPRLLLIPTGIILLIFGGTTLLQDSTLAFNIHVGAEFLVYSIIVSGLVTRLYKYHSDSSKRLRRQTFWVILGLLVFGGADIAQDLIDIAKNLNLWAFGSTPIPEFTATTIIVVEMLFLPVAISIALLSSSLWKRTHLIRSTLVYGILTAGLLIAYVLIVSSLVLISASHNNPLIPLLATVLIALSFHPANVYLSRAINHLFYGELDNPYALLSRLGRGIEAAGVPQAVLPRIVETVAQTLKLPFVAIALKDGQELRIAAEYGTRDDQYSLAQVGLFAHHEQIGALLCAPRPEDEIMTEPDLRLLQDLARQVSAAVHAVQLAHELQLSRERLVEAREEERRRLRRDLHDGLGPTLASLAQRINAAVTLIPERPEEAIALLQVLKGQVRTTISEIRRLVYALRPAVLDEFGLISAISDYTIPAHQSSSVHISLRAPETLPPLSAATEVAAFRIIEEAVTNVMRHAEARQCLIQLELTAKGELALSVTDDGKGLGDTYRTGVGMYSMRERSQELGGSFDIQTRPNGGTQIQVSLPITKEDIIWTPSVS